MSGPNPFSITEGKPATISSFVCYADILGYSRRSKEAIASGNGDAFLIHLRKALTTAYERVREEANIITIPSFAVKVFTDNIVVGYPLQDEDMDYGEPELGSIFLMFAEYQAFLSSKSFFIRGGISFGDHYMDDDIVFGDALIEAVKLDKQGGPPRLTLAPSVIELVKKHISFYHPPNFAPQYDELLCDADGELFINYLAYAFSLFPDGPILFELITEHKDRVVEGLSVYRAFPGIRAKYEWTARYHNFVCRDFMERHPVPQSENADEEYVAACQEAQNLSNCLIDIESLAAEPGRIDINFKI